MHIVCFFFLNNASLLIFEATVDYLLGSRVWTSSWKSDLHKRNDPYWPSDQRWEPSRRRYHSQGLFFFTASSLAALAYSGDSELSHVIVKFTIKFEHHADLFVIVAFFVSRSMVQ